MLCMTKMLTFASTKEASFLEPIGFALALDSLLINYFFVNIRLLGSCSGVLKSLS